MIPPIRRGLAVSLITVFLLAMSFVGVLRLSSESSAYSAVSITVQSPSFAGMSETISITVIVSGGPAADIGGNYSYKDVEMSGTNTTGWQASPLTQTSESGIFKINLTMPGEADQTVRVSLNATSKAAGTDAESYATTEFKIRVVEPISISVTVYNKGEVDAQNATAQIFADGLLLDTQIINVSADSSETITYNWTFSSIRNGKHVVTVKINDPTGLVEFNDGNNVYTLTIYVGSQANPAGTVLTVGLMIAIVLFVLTYMQKPVRRGKKP